jgi:hypothetical protein
VVARLVARDLGNRFPDSPEAAIDTFQHSLSIANAYHRRLVREDVVLELTRLFQLENESKADVSPPLS